VRCACFRCFRRSLRVGHIGVALRQTSRGVFGFSDGAAPVMSISTNPISKCRQIETVSLAALPHDFTVRRLKFFDEILSFCSLVIPDHYRLLCGIEAPERLEFKGQAIFSNLLSGKLISPSEISLDLRVFVYSTSHCLKPTCMQGSITLCCSNVAKDIVRLR